MSANHIIYEIAMAREEAKRRRELAWAGRGPELLAAAKELLADYPKSTLILHGDARILLKAIAACEAIEKDTLHAEKATRDPKEPTTGEFRK